jgi:hypothetical protein
LNAASNMSNEIVNLLYEQKFGACASILMFPQWTEKKKVAVSYICLPVYSDWIPCEGETNSSSTWQWLLCVCIGATSIRRWVTWNRDEHERHTWTCQNVVHAANTVTQIVANDDESFNKDMKWKPGGACHTVSKKEGWNCTVIQQCYGILWIAYRLIFGLKWEPKAQLSLLFCCTNCSVHLVKKSCWKRLIFLHKLTAPLNCI